MSDVPQGRFVWYDLMSTDPDGAVDFYNKVTGWGTEVWEGGNPGYRMWTTPHGPIGGVMALPDEARAAGAPTHWLAYIATSDTDATVARAQELGAVVLVPPMDIPTVGRFAVLRDPAGAVFAAFTPAGDAPGHAEAPRVGEFSWHELMTEDHEKGFDFYADLFGWTKGDSMDMGEMGTYQMFNVGSSMVGGMMNRPPMMPVSAWLYYVRVGDLDAALEAVAAHGGSVVNGPMEVPGGDRVAQCIDPQGGAFALHASASA